MSHLVPAALAVAMLLSASVPTAAQQTRVDLELVIAVDISGSVDYCEGRLQRQGYIDAFRNPKLLEVIRNGRHGRIAVTYVEWAGWGLFRQTVPWMVVGDAQSADAFGCTVERWAFQSWQGTSISGALDVSRRLFSVNPFQGDRRVIDVSGDGPNNRGLSVTYFRDLAVAEGITINGLPILASQGLGNVVAELDVYYKECAIGGPGAFVIAAQNFETFAEAILRKLILEVADIRPSDVQRHPEVIAAQFLQPGRPGAGAPQGPLLDAPPKYYPYCNSPNNNRPTIFPVPGDF